MKTKDSKQNLCDSCQYCQPTCEAIGIKFGDGVGNDNVVECYSFRTNIKNVLFRSSKIGVIASGLIRHDLTEAQRAEMQRLESLKNDPVGLTDNQQSKLNKLLDIPESKLTLKQREDIDALTAKNITPKGLTEKQEKTLAEFKDRDGAEPELSQGAKTYVKEVFLQYEKGFKEEITSKHTRKGKQAEEDAINLICHSDGVMYMKNTERRTKHNLTGECDVITEFENLAGEGSDTITVVDDLKCSWNPKTFMAADLSTLYEWQLRAYMYLYNADIGRIRYCLVDCPPDIYLDELKKFCWANEIIDETDPKYADLIAQFESNYLYEHSGKYTKEERVKTYEIERDEQLEGTLLKAIDLALEYYQTITLNMK